MKFLVMFSICFLKIFLYNVLTKKKKKEKEEVIFSYVPLGVKKMLGPF
jgi:hypothetical protein